MNRRQPIFGELRAAAAPFMLGVFLLAVQLAPFAHLVAHRPDHTHGGDRGHAAAHRAGVAHGHEHEPSPDDGPTPDHGQGSSAHFGLALVQGPTTFALPLPAERLAPLPVATPGGPLDPDLLQRTGRGPPVLPRLALLGS